MLEGWGIGGFCQTSDGECKSWCTCRYIKGFYSRKNPGVLSSSARKEEVDGKASVTPSLHLFTSPPPVHVARRNIYSATATRFCLAEVTRPLRGSSACSLEQASRPNLSNKQLTRWKWDCWFLQVCPTRRGY